MYVESYMTELCKGCSLTETLISPSIKPNYKNTFKRGYGQTGSKAHLPAVFFNFQPILMKLSANASFEQAV